MPVEDQSQDEHLHYKLGDIGLSTAEQFTPALARLGPVAMDPCLV